MINKHLARLREADRSFLKSSAIVAGGFAVARVLGLGFSLVLARLLSPDAYGFIQYMIVVGTLMTVLTMPLAQHILARRISEESHDQQRADATFSNFVVGFAAVFLLTVVLSFPILLAANSLYLGAFVIFAGVSLFYLYFGLARGFVASARLSIAFVSSNLLQLVAILVVYRLLGGDDPLAATLIYGLSYLPPIVLLTLFSPLPVRFRFSLVSPARVRAFLPEAIPIWLSQAGYLLGQNLDVLLVRAFAGDSTLGVYAFTKTLCLIFEMVPGGIQTIILPRMAQANTSASRRKLLYTGMGITLGFNVVILVVFLLVYEPLVRAFFSQEYIIPLHIVLIMAVAQSLQGVQNILSNTLLGMNRAWLDTANRIIMFIASPVAGFLLIPPLGLLGAALANVLSVSTYIAAFPLLVQWARRRDRAQVVAQPVVASAD